MTDSILTSDFLSVSSLLFRPVTSVDSGGGKRPRVTLELQYRSLYYGIMQYKEHQGFTLWSLHVLQVFTDFSSTTNLSVGVTVRLDVFYVALAMCPGVWPQHHPKTAGSLHSELLQNYQKACLNLSVVAIQFERLSSFFELELKKNSSKWATKLKKKSFRAK